MKTIPDLSRTLTFVALLGLFGALARPQDRAQPRDQTGQGHTQFDQHDQQVTHDWYNQNKNSPPKGLRSQDRLSASEESRVRTRRLPPPPHNNRYVTIGGHVGQIDNNFQLKGVIHLHDSE
jgi:hypothetical protein